MSADTKPGRGASETGASRENRWNKLNVWLSGQEARVKKRVVLNSARLLIAEGTLNLQRAVGTMPGEDALDASTLKSSFGALIKAQRRTTPEYTDFESRFMYPLIREEEAIIDSQGDTHPRNRRAQAMINVGHKLRNRILTGRR